MAHSFVLMKKFMSSMYATGHIGKRSICLNKEMYHFLWPQLFGYFRCKKQYIFKVINVFPKCICCEGSM